MGCGLSSCQEWLDRVAGWPGWVPGVTGSGAGVPGLCRVWLGPMWCRRPGCGVFVSSGVTGSRGQGWSRAGCAHAWGREFVLGG